MVYLKDALLGWYVLPLYQGGRGRGSPTSAYLVAFGVEDSKLCKGKVRPFFCFLFKNFYFLYSLFKFQMIFCFPVPPSPKVP